MYFLVTDIPKLVANKWNEKSFIPMQTYYRLGLSEVHHSTLVRYIPQFLSKRLMEFCGTLCLTKLMQ